MIPQPFVKGAGERVFFGQFEYPPGADIIFDFGNPLCTSAFNTSRIVYNVGSANITGSLIPFGNPGPVYPVLISDRGGLMVTQAVGTGARDRSNYLQFDWSSSLDQTEVVIYSYNGSQLNGTRSYLPQLSGSNNPNAIETSHRIADTTVFVDFYDNGNNFNQDVLSNVLNMNTNNGRNGFNVITTLANNSTQHELFVNANLVSTNSIDITRVNSGSQRNWLGVSSNMRIMAYMRYPKVITRKQVRQIFKLFSQRFFT